MSFAAHAQELFSHHGRQNYKEALAVAKKMLTLYPDKLNKVSFWLACLHCLLQTEKEALAVFQKALNKGCWWSPRMLADEDLQKLTPTNEFQEIIAVCREREKEAQKNASPDLLIKTPINYDPENEFPLLISLHWRNGNALDFSSFWDIQSLRSEYIIAFPQSSQVISNSDFCWDDKDLAKEEVMKAYDHLLDRYNINEVIIAGASQGGRLAVELAAEDLKCKGFIIIIPALPPVKEFNTTINNLAHLELRGAVITGDRDFFFPQTRETCLKLKKLGFPIKLITEVGLGHAISESFPNQLQVALDFLNKG